MQEELASLRAMAPPGELGNLTLAAEDARQAWHLTAFTGVAADVRYALRALAREPGFLAVAVISIALAVGANTAVFSLVDGYLLRPLPIARPSEVLWFSDTTPSVASGALSHPDYRDLRAASRSFSGLVAFRRASLRVAADAFDPPRTRTALIVSENFFSVLGIVPPLGRAFLGPEEERSADQPSVILGHDFWMDQYGGEGAILGRSLRINGIVFTIIGVAPASFPGIGNPSFVFVPLSLWDRLGDTSDRNPLENRELRRLTVAGRLRAGVSPEAAQAEVAAISSGLERQYPATNRNHRIVARSELRARLAPEPGIVLVFAVVLGLAGLLLLVACFNVAGLLLARAHARRREIAIRLAIGAGRVRLVRQLMAESLALALLGGAFGIGCGYAGIRFLSGFREPWGPPTLDVLRLDWRVLLFSLATALASCLLFGLAPALLTTRTDMVPALKDGGGAPGVGRRLLGRHLLVVGQITVTVVLMTVAGMMLEGLRARLAVDPGFERERVLAVNTDPSALHYSADRTRQFYRVLGERARALHGVRSVALGESVPLLPARYTVIPEGYRVPEGENGARVPGIVCDERYFATLQIRLLRGRGFTIDDRRGTRPVAIVNEEFAQRYWPARTAIGKRFRLDRATGVEVEIVGIARMPLREDFMTPTGPAIFLPYEQNPRPRMALIVEHDGDASGLAGPLRDIVRSLDPEHPIPDMLTLMAYERAAADVWATIVYWIASLALAGLALAVVGLYALISYSVSRRTAEIGLRMAVGSTPASVLRLVVGQGLAHAAIGVLIAGVLIAVPHAALAGTPGVRALVTIMPPNAPTYVTIPLVVLAVGALAAYVPARRAAGIDPIQALRHE